MPWSPGNLRPAELVKLPEDLSSQKAKASLPDEEVCESTSRAEARASLGKDICGYIGGISKAFTLI